jgi:hypothetical protein
MFCFWKAKKLFQAHEISYLLSGSPTCLLWIICVFFLWWVFHYLFSPVQAHVMHVFFKSPAGSVAHVVLHFLFCVVAWVQSLLQAHVYICFIFGFARSSLSGSCLLAMYFFVVVGLVQSKSECRARLNVEI